MSLPNPRLGLSLCAAALVASACATPTSDTGPSEPSASTVQRSARLYVPDAGCIEWGTLDLDARYWPPSDAALDDITTQVAFVSGVCAWFPQDVYDYPVAEDPTVCTTQACWDRCAEVQATQPDCAGG